MVVITISMAKSQTPIPIKTSNKTCNVFGGMLMECKNSTFFFFLLQMKCSHLLSMGIPFSKKLCFVYFSPVRYLVGYPSEYDKIILTQRGDRVCCSPPVLMWILQWSFLTPLTIWNSTMDLDNDYYSSRWCKDINGLWLFKRNFYDVCGVGTMIIKHYSILT